MDNKPLFGVIQQAYEGDTYLGMVVRENGTYEKTSQRLVHPLKKGRCYSFSIMLCRSDTYQSGTRFNTNTMIDYTEPVILRIWGGEGFCHQKELLTSSSLIENTDWKKYEFEFKVNSDLNFILLEAFYNEPAEFPYNGNILLDDSSDIYEIDCNLLKTK